MKKIILTLVVASSLIMTSCYTLTYSVGEGAKTGVEVKAKNNYLIYGLVPLKTSNPTQMADGAKDYTVKTEKTFVDGFISYITVGIFSTSTTTVTK